MRRSSEIVKKVVAARREERGKWGDTAYLLRPNVKRSRGALRDIQLIRWIGFARYGETDLERLLKLGALPEEDYRYLRQAYAFMLSDFAMSCIFEKERASMFLIEGLNWRLLRRGGIRAAMEFCPSSNSCRIISTTHAMFGTPLPTL